MARKILLADDSVTAQNMGRKILADAGYDVFTVNNGSAALKRISEVKPDLIVLDVYMPGYSGLEVCQRLKDAAETGHIPVLLTVGKLEPFKPEEARRVRADAHIVKPFEASELLTAITRLEDRMVPMADGSRFSNSVSGVERFSGDSGRKTEGSDDADTGWKSRLRFPSKKKKEEPEPEPEEIVPEATFRNYRKGKSGKSGPGPAITVKPPAPPGQEPGLVPDIPRDITPDELDALSALAAKLDGPIPAAENIAPMAEKVGPVETPAPEIAKGLAEVEVPVAEAPKEPAKQAETPAAIAEFAVTPASSPAPSAEVQIQVQAQGSAASATEVPAAEPATQPAPVVTAPAVIEAIAETSVAVAVSAAAPQEAVPLDRTPKDEPQVSEAAIEKPVAEPKIEAVAEAKAETKLEPDKSEPEVVAPVAETSQAEVVAKTEPVAVAALEEAKPEAKPEEDQRLEAVKDIAPTVEAAQPKSPEPESPRPEVETPRAEEPAPSEEELAEALRLLTPATGSVDVATIPSHGTLVAAGQLLAEEAARNAAAGPRWIAESVALSPEEAALSLEDEMFRTFATTPAAVPGTTRSDEGQRTGITGVSAIAAAVENRMAEAEKIASVSASATSPAIDTAVSAQSEPVVAAVKNEAEPAEETASATFADAISTNREAVTENEKAENAAADAPTQAVQSAEVATASTSAVVEAKGEDSSSDSGGDEAMGKDGKSTWRQIRTAPAGAGSNADAVEAAKTEAANEAPKAMAAAAAADGSASGSANDAASIASIVDSVMADLRPKIVEEIAKKLAGK
ncbi:MAG TPA: response regulator [Terriglobales bacterium]|nr:response regulator [Terriglobales bacterium]